MINDREVGDSLIWKFADDITAFETVPKGNASQIQKKSMKLKPDQITISCNSILSNVKNSFLTSSSENKSLTL